MMRTLISGLLVAATLTATVLGSNAMAAGPTLITPRVIITDSAAKPAQIQAQSLAARRYATFWQSGDPALAQEALAADFMDRALPPGRPQGIAGPLAASKAFHGAVPDLQCEIQQLIVSGDRVVSHLRFTGHFTGTFNGVQGQGQAVNFIATDIYRIADGRIAENWHLEDNLTFLQQIGLVGH
jgi:predicted ester cyclase